MKTYKPTTNEAKWVKIWEKTKAFEVDIKNAKKPFYNLAMFPYPSGEGLHMGHIIPYSGVDTYGRFLRMNGSDVFEPMGFDAFGIHSENFAIKKGIHPKTLIANTTTYFREKQMKRLGTLFDWEREVNTTDPDYYKWTQWLFIQMFKHGLAEKRKAPVTYCPSCKTVLSDEQTEIKNNVTVCERCKTPIERKELEQWFFKITKYADRLLSNLNHLDADAFGKNKAVSQFDQEHGINWSEKTKNAQRNWIGKSEGVMVKFKVKDLDISFATFDSVPQTFMAQTFTVIAPEHPKVYELVKGTKYEKPVMEFVEKIKLKRAAKKIDLDKDVEGIFTGRYMEYTPGKRLLPIWLASFVIADYGTGVVNCSAHDERDFAFAKKYDLPLHPVMFPQSPEEAEKVKNLEYCYHHAENGVLTEPEEFKGRKWGEARNDIISYIEKNGWGKGTSEFHLRDWCISRQRYWGPPVPMINCPKCGWQPVPEKDLPVILPFIKDYKPAGDGRSPLAKDAKWMKIKCPKCGGWAERETDVSDTFLDSAWYFMRYPSVGLPTSGQAPFDNTVTKKWLPVDMYIGGHEHAVLHLMYSRFVTMALKDMGFIDFEEPFVRFFAHGLMTSEGAKMSKSRGNVVNPNEYMDKYGSDTLRMYILFMGPYDAGSDFRMAGIAGMHRFLKRIWTLVNSSKYGKETDLKLAIAQNKAIKKVGEDIGNLHFNTAIAAIMEYYNTLTATSTVSEEAIKTLLLLMAPFAPFITEELWQNFAKSSIHSQPWPKFDPKFLIEEEIIIVVQVNGKIRDKITVNSKQATDKELLEKMALQSPKLSQFLGGQKVKKSIFVPGKLINFVV